MHQQITEAELKFYFLTTGKQCREVVLQENQPSCNAETDAEDICQQETQEQEPLKSELQQ